METTELPYEYIPKFVVSVDDVFTTLWNTLPWERREGTPRRELYFSTIDVDYTYGRGRGRRTYKPKPFSPIMSCFKSILENYTGTKFEVCFVNGYENSKDQLGWHADDSPEMDDTRPIGVISLGAPREIWVRKNDGLPMDIPSKILLEPGSLFLMKPGMQDTHQHRIPKADREVGPRISLTFRGYTPVQPI